MSWRAETLLVLLVGCGGDPSEPPLFPADYAATYTEVRNCRPSIEHGAVNVHVLAAPDALETYTTRTGPFSTGAIVLKEEYAEQDDTCAGPIRAWTVMEKLDDGTSPATLDWHWQKVNAQRTTTSVNDETCTTCHAMCDSENGGYLHTCTQP
jgi:hypothetical protein